MPKHTPSRARPAPDLRDRRGVSSLLLVALVAVMGMTWGIAQNFVTSSIRKNVILAQAGRRCQMHALTAVEEALDFVRVEANEEPEPGDDDSVALQLRSLEPGQMAELFFEPELSELPRPGEEVRTGAVRILAYLRELHVPEEEGPDERFCEKMHEFNLKWSRIPG